MSGLARIEDFYNVGKYEFAPPRLNCAQEYLELGKMIREPGIVITPHVDVHIRIMNYVYGTRTTLPEHIEIAPDAHVLEFDGPGFTLWTVTYQVNGRLVSTLRRYGGKERTTRSPRGLCGNVNRESAKQLSSLVLHGQTWCRIR